MTALDLTPMRTTQPEGKSYHRIEFEEDFDLGAYHGNQAMVWKDDVGSLPALMTAAKGKLCVVELAPSAKNPEWSPGLAKVAVKETGEVVFTQKQGGGGGGNRGGRKGGGGDWETGPERLFKNLSIEAQSAAGRVSEVVAAAVARGVEPSVALGLLEDWTPKITAAIRNAAEQSEGGGVAAILAKLAAVAAAAEKAGSQASDQPRAAESATPAGSTGEQAPSGSGSESTPSGNGGPSLNDAMAVYKTKRRLLAAFEYVFGDGTAPDDPTKLNQDTLSTLIEDADDILPNL